jgi:ATP-dependent DNA ligase
MKIPKIDLKAMKAKEVPLEKLSFPMIAQLKFDGVRLITKIVEDMPIFYTYNGSEVPLPKLGQRILEARLGNIMLDGEIVIQGGKVGTRPAVAGMINSALHNGSINESQLEYVLFDGMHLYDFERQQCNLNYEARYRNTMYCASDAKLQIARNQIVKSPVQVQELSEQLYNDGFEGLILKSLHHLYSFKRSKDWVKIKETKTADLICVDITLGTGKYTGMIGALVCKGKVENKDIIVKVGSGLNDNQRGICWSEFVGKTIEVKYNSVIQDQRTGDWSLFLPRFVARRFDK